MQCRWTRFAVAAIAVGTLLIVGAAPACADYEYWNVVESRIPLTQNAPVTNRSVYLRVLTDFRYGWRYPGSGGQFLRAGPVWAIAPDWWLGTHVTTVAKQSAPGILTQEFRAELEPTWTTRIGDWSIQDRNRLEYRYRPTSAHLRYRNQLRVQFNPTHWRVFPYAWVEPLYEFNAEGLGQLRYQIGMAQPLSPSARLDTGLMLRQRTTPDGGWANDWILNTTLLFAPGVTPIFDSPSDD